MTEIRIPNFGTSGDAVEILEILVAEGDTVAAGQKVIEAASDKVDFAIESEVAGRVTSLQCAVGDEVTMGTVVLVVEPNA